MSDRRFGYGRKFGTSTKFGATTTNSFCAWIVEVDWDGDGVFDGSTESRFMTGISISRGRKRQVDSTGAGFEQQSVGKASIELSNIDGRYNGWNTASVLYPNVTYGRDVRIKIRDLVAGTVEPVFYGVISDIQPSGYGSDAKVTITVDDGWNFLRNYTARVAVQLGVAPHTAIGAILDYVRWPTRWGRSLETSSDTIPYWWTSGDKTAASEIQDVAYSFIGNFFIDASGQAVYQNRSTVSDLAVEFLQEYMLKDIGNPQPWVNSRNVIRIKTHPRALSGTETLYQLTGVQPSILAGESYSLFGQYTYNNQTVPAYSIVAPVASTDYVMNTAADGSGTDKTADCTVTATNLGDTVKLVITNNSLVTVYITTLQVRGVAVYEVSASDVFYPTDPDTVEQPREFILDQLWLQDVNVALDSINILGEYFSTLKPMPIIQIENRFAYQFGLELFDSVTANIGYLGISGESYKIGGIEHKSYGENCQRVVTTFYLEPYPFSGEYWAWDTRSVFGTDLFGA